jgi:hypothetical protein
MKPLILKPDVVLFSVEMNKMVQCLMWPGISSRFNYSIF